MHYTKLYIAITLMTVAVVTGYAEESAKPTWEKDVTKKSIPVASVKGMANGVSFSLKKARIHGGILTLTQGKGGFKNPEFTIFMHLKKGETLSGKKFLVKQGDRFRAPHIHFTYPVEGGILPELEMFMTGYTMNLEFGKTTGTKISGKIYLCLPDKAKSFVAGTFETEIE